MCDGMDIEASQDGVSSYPCVHCGHTCYSYGGGDFTLIDDLRVIVFSGQETQVCLFEL